MVAIFFHKVIQKRELFMRSLATSKFVLNIARHFPRSYKIIEQTGFDQNDPFKVPSA